MLWPHGVSQRAEAINIKSINVKESLSLLLVAKEKRDSKGPVK